MKIVIPGGSGQVGTMLARRFHAKGDEVVVLSRNPVPAAWRIVPWDAQTRGEWEKALNSVPTPHTRKVALRSAMTMSADRDGVFDVLLGLVRRGLGGRAGDGKQFVSWIHEADFLAAVEWLIQHDMSGAVNLSAP